jgi:hypothetical protein
MPTGKKGGRPSHLPDDEKRQKIAEFACSGITHLQIANYFDISVTTLREHYKNELENVKLDKIKKMAKNVYARGVNGSVKDAHFWLKTQAGWKEAKDDAPLEANALLNEFVSYIEAKKGGNNNAPPTG